MNGLGAWKVFELYLTVDQFRTMLKTIKLYLILFVFTVSFFKAQAQDSTNCEVKLNGAYALSYWQDAKMLVSAPARWKKKQWLTFGGVVATSAVIYQFADQDLKDWSQKNKNDQSQVVSDAVEKIGNGRYPVFSTAGLYLYGSIFKKEKPKRVALLVLESYALSGLASQVAKFAANRLRPWNNARYNEWRGPKIKDTYASFFSGHSSTAFSFATVFAMEYKDKKWVAPVAYSLAGLSAVSRIHDNAHWASDVFIGSVVGYYFARAIVKQHVCKDSKLSINPAVLQGGIAGVQLHYNL